MLRFNDFEDNDLRMRIPKYLRRIGGIRAFFPFGKNKDEATITSMAVDVTVDNEYTEDLRQQYLTYSAGKVWDIDGVRTTSLRAGCSKWVEGGVDNLSRTDSVHVPGGSMFGYSLLYIAGRCRVQISIGGRLNQELFEAACEQIVKSIEIKPSALAGKIALPPIQKNRKVKTYKLPDNIKYLESALMELSRFSPESLGDANDDASQIVDAAVRARVRGMSKSEAEEFLQKDIEVIEELLVKPKLATSPLPFVYGMLQGFISFGGLDSLPD